LFPERKVRLVTMNNYSTLEKVIKQETEHITHKYNSVKWLNNFKFSYVEVSTGVVTVVQYVQKYTVSTY